VWWANKLKPQLEFLENNPQCNLSFTDYLHHSPQNQLLGTCFEFWKPNYVTPSSEYHLIDNAEHELLALNMVGTSTCVVRRKAMNEAGNFNLKISSCEDWELWLKLAHKGKVAFANVVSMSYLMRPQSVTANITKRIDAMQLVIEPYAAQPLFKEAHKAAKARINIARAELARQNNQYFSAFTYHLKAFMVLKTKRLLVAALSDAFGKVKF
jgi:HAMP domain-containing protein